MIDYRDSSTDLAAWHERFHVASDRLRSEAHARFVRWCFGLSALISLAWWLW